MNKIFTKLLTLILLLAFTSVEAQDIHFSQFYASPLMLNPAMTGFFDGNYRFTAIARSQWGSVTVPYQTAAASADMSFKTGFGNKDMYGIGINVMSDRAGTSQFTTTSVNLSTAYSKSLDAFQHNFLSVGIQGGFNSGYIDYSKLTFDENFEGGSTTENFAYNTTDFADVSSGLQYTYLANKVDNATAGIAVFHINEPRESFFADPTSIVYRKIVFNASATYALGPKISLFPKLEYMVQGPNTELDFGGFVRYDLAKTTNEPYGFYLGLMNRWGDAIAAATRFDLDNLAIIFSYDFNYSSLATVSHGMAGPELSIIYIGDIKTKHPRKVYCPVF